MEATPRHRPLLHLARHDAPRVAGSPVSRDTECWGPSPALTDRALLLAMHEDRGSVWVLSLSGEADVCTQRLLEDELDTALSMRRESLVLDVTRLTFCDVACAQRVLTATRTAPALLVGAAGEVKRVFELLDADEALPRRTLSGGPGHG